MNHAAVFLSALVVCLPVVGCGGGEEQNEADKRGDAAAKKSTQDSDEDGVLDPYDEDPNDAALPAGEEEQAGPREATVGDNLVLSTAGTELRVTIRKVLDPLPVTASEEVLSKPSNRFVGLLVTAKNEGQATYDGASGNDVTLQTTDGEQAEESDVSSGECALRGQDFFARVSPDTTRRGCVVFELTPRQQPGTVQVTLDSGTADDTGEWKVP